MREYFKVMGISLIPAILIFLGKNDSFFGFLIKKEVISSSSNVPNIQMYCFFFGIIWSGLITPIQLAYTRNSLKEKRKQYVNLLKDNKENLFNSSFEKFRQLNRKFNTRIFLPKSGFEMWLSKMFRKKYSLHLKHFDGICDPMDVKSLSFECYPTPQGIVGMAYNEKKILIDCEVDPEKADYHLTAYQKDTTVNVKFCIAAPFINTKNRVVAVLSIDSEESIDLTIEEKTSINKIIKFYCGYIDKHLKFRS